VVIIVEYDRNSLLRMSLKCHHLFASFSKIWLFGRLTNDEDYNLNIFEMIIVVSISKPNK